MPDECSVQGVFRPGLVPQGFQAPAGNFWCFPGPANNRRRSPSFPTAGRTGPDKSYTDAVLFQTTLHTRFTLPSLVRRMVSGLDSGYRNQRRSVRHRLQCFQACRSRAGPCSFRPKPVVDHDPTSLATFLLRPERHRKSPIGRGPGYGCAGV